MQKARSGLAAAAARWQLVDAPEGESSLQRRLDEAERRAHDAEASAQSAQAALARTLLDAARVEAVVTARMKAKSEAEIGTLRAELDALKHATSTVETALHVDRSTSDPDIGDPDIGDQDIGDPDFGDQRIDPDREAQAATEPVSPEATVPDSPDNTETPDAAVASDDDAAAEDAVDDEVAEAGIAQDLRIPEDARPEWVAPPEAVVAESSMLRFLPPARIGFLAVVGIVAVISYYVTNAIMEGRDHRAAVASGAGPVAAEGVLHDTGTDAKSIAEASASLDAEMARLEVLSQKVEALRSALAVRRQASPTRKIAADRVPSGSGANWLLYMPVERAALVEYLAGRSWPGIQMAAQPGAKTSVQR